MATQLAVVLFLVCFTLATIDAKSSSPTRSYTVKIVEGGKTFKEKILVNVKAGYEYYHVPAHGNVDETKMILDYKRKLVLTKDVKRHICYLRKYEKDDSSPRSLERGLEKENLRFPWRKYLTSNGNELIIRTAYPTEMNSKPFQKLCGGNAVYFTKRAPTTFKEIEEFARKIVTSGGQGWRTKRENRFLKSFVACNPMGTSILGSCLKKDRSGRKLKSSCRFKSKGCIYASTCTLDKKKGGFTCLHVHKYSNLVCCDYTCES